MIRGSNVGGSLGIDKSLHLIHFNDKLKLNFAANQNASN